MTKRAKWQIGVFLRIPLTDGSFGYGRVLQDPYVAFYNYHTIDAISDLDLIESQPILFKVGVRLPGTDRWAQIGKRDLQGEAAKPVVLYKQALSDFRKCTIYDSEGMDREVAPEECIGLEKSAIWEPHAIEDRLLDAFLGRPNEDEVRLRVRLK